MELNRIKKTWNKLRQSINSVVVISFGLSFFLWMLIRLSLTYRTVVAVDLKYFNLPQNVVWTSPPRSIITVEVEADGWSLLRWKWLRGPRVSIDMKEQSDHQAFLVTQNFRNDIATQLNAAKSLGAIFPDTLRLVSEKLDTMKLPTVFTGKIEYAEGYAPSTKVAVNPPEITVIGPVSAIARMRSVTNKPINFTDLSKSLHADIRWELPKNVRTDSSRVGEVRQQIEATTEKWIEVPVSVNGASSVSVYPPVAKLRVAVPLSRYERVGEWDFRVEAEIPDADIQPDYINLEIAEKPWFVEITEIRPQRVEYLLKYD